jgi:hypothetical protein
MKVFINFTFFLFQEIYRLDKAPKPGNYLDVSARNNISPCKNIDDFNPYNYQSWLAGIGDVVSH